MIELTSRSYATRDVHACMTSKLPSKHNWVCLCVFACHSLCLAPQDVVGNKFQSSLNLSAVQDYAISLG